ncbi:MAG: serine/threonine-protein kinase [Balneolaceae bacterium]|nr:serine/threonine-protein kinase [Balneolaceae bacterium]
MSDINWQKVETILDKALELPKDQRQEFIDEECKGKPKLKGEVTLLLDSIFDSEGWLENPEEYKRDMYDEMADDVQLLSSNQSLIDTKVGSYLIKEKIGEGGMGSVYLAKHSSADIDHKVAIKIIRSGKATQENIKRFKREQQILAGLHHPGIARMYDAGTTGDGSPYIIMEYVDGMPITDYCEKDKCTLQQKLELFTDVLQAVRHAHENLVIHRDLKPENILVDESGNIKILDFGISKLLENSDDTSLTKTGARLLTPRYAAPEQVRQENITTATDLYALGIVFYELIAGGHPFSFEDFSQYEMEQAILKQEAVKPSTKVAGSKAEKQLQGDLDAIALKAIRKESEHRYRMANEFLEDLKNYQNGIPVSAIEDSLRYRSQKFFKRHKQGIAVAAGILLFIFGLSGFYTWQIAQERDVAQLEAEKAEQVTDFLIDLFNQSNPYFEEIQGGLNAKIGPLLEYGTNQIDKELEDQAEVRAELKTVVGRIYSELGEFGKAETLLTASLELKKQLYQTRKIEIARSMSALAFLHQEQGNYSSAESLLVNSIHIFENSQNKFEDEEYFKVMRRFGNLLWFNKGEYEKADSVLQRTLKLRRKYSGSDKLGIAATLNDLATLNHAQGKYSQAAPFYRESIDIYQRIYNEHANLAIIMSNFSALLREKGNYDEAEKYQQQALEMHQNITGEESIDVALGLGNLGSIALGKNQLEKADSLLSEAVKKLKIIYSDLHPYISRTKLNIGRLYIKQQNYEKAESILLEVNNEYQKVFPPGHPRSSDPLLELGTLYLKTKKYEKSRTYLEKAHKIRVEGYPKESWRIAETMNTLGFCLSRMEKYQEADTLLNNSFKQLKNARGEKDPVTEMARSNLIDHYSRWGKPLLLEKFQSKTE